MDNPGVLVKSVMASPNLMNTPLKETAFKIKIKYCNKRFMTNKLKLQIAEFANEVSFEIKQIKNPMKLIRLR